MTQTRRIGLVVHAGRDESRRAAARAAQALRDANQSVVVIGEDDLVDDTSDELAQIGTVVAADDFSSTVGFALSFGGDGTFLRAAHLCRDAKIPVLGVNLGRLGFLAEVELDGLDEAIDAVARGAYVVEHRSTLEAFRVDGNGDHHPIGWALNEVSVEKTARQRLLLMDVHIGGQWFARVPADALVVATSTGSTAYALSAGGPILSPRVNGTLVVPVAPHSLFDRTVVASPDEGIDIDVLPSQPAGLVSCDGREPLEVSAGSRVHVRGGSLPLAIARLAPVEFYGLVRRKFGLN
ncbi:MAG: NAD(+)/NADH kinase [Nitriliruptoraceae bacterium]